jgi:hypothetical protein
MVRARVAQRGQGRWHGSPKEEEEHGAAVSGGGGELGHDHGEYERGAGSGWKRNNRGRKLIWGLRSARHALTGHGG